MNKGLLHLLKANIGADPVSKDQISQEIKKLGTTFSMRKQKTEEDIINMNMDLVRLNIFLYCIKLISWIIDQI